MSRDQKAGKKGVIILARITGFDCQREVGPRLQNEGRGMFYTQVVHLGVSWYPLTKDDGKWASSIPKVKDT